MGWWIRGFSTYYVRFVIVLVLIIIIGKWISFFKLFKGTEKEGEKKERKIFRGGFSRQCRKNLGKTEFLAWDLEWKRSEERGRDGVAGNKMWARWGNVVVPIRGSLRVKKTGTIVQQQSHHTMKEKKYVFCVCYSGYNAFAWIDWLAWRRMLDSGGGFHRWWCRKKMVPMYPRKQLADARRTGCRKFLI